MESPAHVFISFKTQEREFAFRLKTALNQSGYRVWWQDEIQCGQEWHGEIDKAIEVAGAIVVLWSEKSMASTWVRHEASQATIKGIYAPARIELIEIESPYNRIQATDIINWNGDLNHPGFQSLLMRLRVLMPPPVPVSLQIRKFFSKYIVTIISSIIAIVALSLLFKQSSVLDEQIEKQEDIFKSVQKQNLDLQLQRKTLQSQLKKQDLVLTNGYKQSKLLNTQLEQQRVLSLNTQQQSDVLKLQIKKQENLSAQSLNIISRQKDLADSLNKSSELIKDNLKVQQQSFGVLKSSSEDLKGLNFPIANGLLYSYKVRVYVEGIKDIWNENNKNPYIILNEKDTVSSFIKKRIYKFPKNSYIKFVDPYQEFFSNVSMAIGVSTILKYELDNKTNVVNYFENGASNFSFWSAPKNIFFNPVEEYFESDFTTSSGAVKANPEKISNLFSLFNNSDILLLFRFTGKDKYELPIKGSSKIVKVKKIVLSTFSQLRYGNNFQFFVIPGDRLQIISSNEIEKQQSFLGEVDKQEMWRYCFATIPLTRN